MKKKVLTAVMAGALSASMVFPAFATSASSGGATPSADGTEVWAGIVLEDPDAKIKVEVPTLFAFVVNGSVSATDTGAVTSSNGGIMLPNVKVKVNTESGTLPGAAGSSSYTISTTGDGTMKFTNYSTVSANDAVNSVSYREGLKVKINGNIKNEGSPVSRNYWEHVDAIGTALTTEFKKYNISIDGAAFNTGEDGGLTMASAITLTAPSLGGTYSASGYTYTNMNTTTNLANTGTEKTVAFDVKVGGQRNQYKQVEESAKVGTIVWTISTEINTNDVYTAPNNEYLDGVDSGVTTDPDSILTP